MKEKIMMTIAGSDSSAGAGIQADIKSAFAAGVYCATVITAVTSQNTCSVRAVANMSPETVSSQIDAVLDDMNVTAVKCGMLPDKEIVETVADKAAAGKLPGLILDPVMIASSGDQLIDNNAIDALINRLLPQAALVTPNIPEACRMTGVDIRSERDFDRAAEVFRRSGCRALLLKTGHLHGKTLTDMLYDFESGKVHGFEFERIDTANTHGTGCSLSASIAARMSQVESLRDAVQEAEEFMHMAIRRGCYRIWGDGHGPIDHFITLQERCGGYKISR